MTESGNVLKEGTILDSGDAKYRIVKVLGHGGFGITYLVEGEFKKGNITTQAKFAIKEHYPSVFCQRINEQVVPKEDNLNEYNRSKESFISEAKKLYKIGSGNDNIVKVNEVFETNGTAYYVMQYINGVSLSEYIKSKKKLKYSEALNLLAPIFDAVDYLHKEKINHLDIKPDNIMLHDSIEGKVPVLIDFGLSLHFKKNGDKTSPNAIMGKSEGYSPQEQYAGIKEFSPATDIYALVATLLYTINGVQPKSATDLKLDELKTQLSNIVPQDYIEGICKALKKSSDDRTSSISVLKSDLGITGGNDTDVIIIEEEKKKRLKIILFILAVIIIGGLCWWLFTLPGTKELEAEQQQNPGVVSDTTAVITNPEEIIISETPADSASQKPVQESPSVHPPKQPETQSTVQPQAQPSTTYSAPAVTNGTLEFGYGTWTGGIRNGKPDGKGKLVFSASHQVDRSSSVTASPGDYFMANYENGQLISGKLYDSDGNLLKTIIP